MQVIERPEEDEEGIVSPDPFKCRGYALCISEICTAVAQVYHSKDNLCWGAEYSLMEPHVTSVCQTPSVFTHSDTRKHTDLPWERRTNIQAKNN